MTEKSGIEAFKELLATLSVRVYNVQVDQEDLIVIFGRVLPLVPGDKTLSLSEARLLRWIESALKQDKETENWSLRLSRPWVLKEDKLAYTWDFTIKGDIKEAIQTLSGIHVPKPPEEKEVDVPTQRTQFKRGTVKPVRIGRIV